MCIIWPQQGFFFLITSLHEITCFGAKCENGQVFIPIDRVAHRTPPLTAIVHLLWNVFLVQFLAIVNFQNLDKKALPTNGRNAANKAQESPSHESNSFTPARADDEAHSLHGQLNPRLVGVRARTTSSMEPMSATAVRSGFQRFVHLPKALRKRHHRH